MVVDDSAAIRARLVALLAEARGVEIVGEAAGGEQAIALARALAPDLVVLDLNLPRVPGLEVLAELKRFLAPPIVIVMTNHVHEHYRAECLRAGADYFFDKSREFDRVAHAASTATRRT